MSDEIQEIIREQEDNLIQLSELIEEMKISIMKELLTNSIFILFFVCLNSLLFSIVTFSNSTISIFHRTLMNILVQISILMILNIFIKKSVINNKEIEENCFDLEYVLKVYNNLKSKEYPIAAFLKKGLRTTLTNENIFLIVIMIFLNCIIWFGSMSLFDANPIDDYGMFQTTIIEGVPYAIVYREGNKYFLEESNVIVEEGEGKETLVIYTNRQRIVICDDISIVVKEYDDIIKENK